VKRPITLDNAESQAGIEDDAMAIGDRHSALTSVHDQQVESANGPLLATMSHAFRD
jgi:hypothetical protein